MASLITNNPPNKRKNTNTNKYGSLTTNNVAVAKRVATTRLNSTSTLFVDSTLAQPNNKTTIRAVAVAIQKKVSDSFEETPFDEAVEPDAVVQLRKIPTTGECEYVIRHIFKTGQLSVDCNIISLVYLDRISQSGVTITAQNWRPLVVLSLMMASKIWDDLSMINEDFSTFLPFSLIQLNKWEIAFLNKLSFNVRVKASEYARYYFSLRQGSSMNTNNNSTSSSSTSSGDVKAEPLDMEGAHRLEALTVSAQSRFETLYGKAPDSSGILRNQSSSRVQQLSTASPLRLKRSVSDPSRVSGGKVKSKAMAVLS